MPCLTTPLACPPRQNLVHNRSVSPESHISVIRCNGRAATIVLRLSPIVLSRGDMLPAMNAHWSDMAAINYVGTEPTVSILYPGTPAWSRERFCMGSSRRTSPLGCLSPNVSILPSPRIENPFYGPRRCLGPEPMRSAATESLPESGAIARAAEPEDPPHWW